VALLPLDKAIAVAQALMVPLTIQQAVAVVQAALAFLPQTVLH
jgi:hypothetical protein